MTIYFCSNVLRLLLNKRNFEQYEVKKKSQQHIMSHTKDSESVSVPLQRIRTFALSVSPMRNKLVVLSDAPGTDSEDITTVIKRDRNNLKVR